MLLTRLLRGPFSPLCLRLLFSRPGCPFSHCVFLFWNFFLVLFLICQVLFSLSLKIISIFLPEFLILFCFLSLSVVIGGLDDASTQGSPGPVTLAFSSLIRKSVGLVFFKLVLFGFAGLPELVNWCLIRRGEVPGTIYSNVFPAPGPPRWEQSLGLCFSVRHFSLWSADGLFLWICLHFH